MANSKAKGKQTEQVRSANQSDDAIATSSQKDPVISYNHLGAGAVQGGNFVNSSLHNPVFNIHATSGRNVFKKYYQKLKFKGRGTFGEAWIVAPKNVNAGEELIMKEISCTDKDFDIGKNEIEILKKCKDENIVCYIEHFYEENKLLIIMEYCRGGDLAEFIDAQKEPLQEDLIIMWFRQLASGVCCIHKMKIIHRDLKPGNIFLTLNKTLKIGDFGIAKGLDRTSGKASSFAGTAVYIAPEIHGGEKYGTMADMWSLGVIFYEIITFKNPFHGRGFFKAIQNAEYDRQALKGVSSFISKQVTSLLTTDPQSRPSAEEMLIRLNGNRKMAGGRTKQTTSSENQKGKY